MENPIRVVVCFKGISTKQNFVFESFRAFHFQFIQFEITRLYDTHNTNFSTFMFVLQANEMDFSHGKTALPSFFSPLVFKQL